MADIVTELQESVDRLNEAFYNSVGVLQRDAKPASVVEGADPSEGVLPQGALDRLSSIYIYIYIYIYHQHVAQYIYIYMYVCM